MKPRSGGTPSPVGWVTKLTLMPPPVCGQVCKGPQQAHRPSYTQNRTKAEQKGRTERQWRRWERSVVSTKASEAFEPVCRGVMKWICSVEQDPKTTEEPETWLGVGMKICLSATDMMWGDICQLRREPKVQEDNQSSDKILFRDTFYVNAFHCSYILKQKASFAHFNLQILFLSPL